MQNKWIKKKPCAVWQKYIKISEETAASISKSLSAVVMDAAGSPETSYFYHNTWRRVPEYSNRHSNCHINLRSHERCYIGQDYIHKVPVILYNNLQCESHKPYVPPTIVTWLQLLRKQTNTGTTTALNAETDLRANYFAHSPDLWHNPRLANVSAPEAGDFVEFVLL